MADPTLFESSRAVNEEWRPVIGFEEHYEVSSHGRVRRKMQSRGAVAGKILSLQKWTYLSVNLYKNNVPRSIDIHVLVAEAFLGPREKGMVVNHKDLNKMNNHATNLEWVTFTRNVNHAIENGIHGGLSRPGALGSNAKLTVEQVQSIREEAATNSTRRLGAKYGVSKTCISAIIKGKTWSTEPPRVPERKGEQHGPQLS